MIRVIIPAWQVPDGSIVTKKTGEKEYHLQKDIVVYRENGEKTEIKSDHETFFLIPEDGGLISINCIGANKLVMWLAEPDDLANWLELDYPCFADED